MNHDHCDNEINNNCGIQYVNQTARKHHQDQLLTVTIKSVGCLPVQDASQTVHKQDGVLPSLAPKDKGDLEDDVCGGIDQGGDNEEVRECA